MYGESTNLKQGIKDDGQFFYKVWVGSFRVVLGMELNTESFSNISF